MKIAIYVRVSRIDLHPENQLLELEQYAKAMNWEYVIYEEKESTRKSRPIKKELFDLACKKKFDRILIYKLDRWARSLQELIYDLGILSQHKVGFQSLKESITLDDDPRNMLMIHMLGAFAEFERAMIRERTMSGLARARAEGRIGGRPRKNKEGREPTIDEVKSLLEQGLNIKLIAGRLYTTRYLVEKVLKLNPTLQLNLKTHIK
jgi:DNA invertase Pin-like site-specific DNA recombinase